MSAIHGPTMRAALSSRSFRSDRSTAAPRCSEVFGPVFFSTQPADTRTAPPRTARDPGRTLLPSTPMPLHFAPPRAAAVAPAAVVAIIDMVIAGMMVCVRRVNARISRVTNGRSS